MVLFGSDLVVLFSNSGPRETTKCYPCIDLRFPRTWVCFTTEPHQGSDVGSCPIDQFKILKSLRGRLAVLFSKSMRERLLRPEDFFTVAHPQAHRRGQIICFRSGCSRLRKRLSPIAQQVGYLQPFASNSSECTGQSQLDLILNYRSTRRRFGKPPPCQIWCGCFCNGLCNRGLLSCDSKAF
jgi:hypothetical protein